MSAFPKHLPADERRAAIVEAMVDLAAEHNPSDITTAAIAQRMNLTQGALFRHFRSKNAIQQAVMTWIHEHLLARVDAAAQGSATPLAALEAVFMAHVDFVLRYPGVPKILFGELQWPGDTASKRIVESLIHDYGDRLQALLALGKECAELSPELDEDVAAVLFIGTVQGLVMQSLLAEGNARMRCGASSLFVIHCRGIGYMP